MRACRCGHELAPHEHYRANGSTECSLCPAGACPRFRPPRRWWRLW